MTSLAAAATATAKVTECKTEQFPEADEDEGASFIAHVEQCILFIKC